MKKDGKKFWDKYARFYDFEVLKFSRRAYKDMYSFMSKIFTKDMKVLEIATGTGMISINVAEYVSSIEAIDFSPKMIETAKKKAVPSNLRFSIEDATELSFADETFDAVIISNALHIMAEPELVLKNIRRVLKPNGILVAPSFSHGYIGEKAWKINAFILKVIGFETYSKWTPEEYVRFIEDNGFEVGKWTVLKAGFPLVYLEARKNG